MVNHSVYDSLVTFDGEDLATPKPSLATDWTVSPDGKTYTFRLRRNVRFASGNPLTSADVKWSFDRVRNLKSNPAFFLDSVEDIQTPDPLTVVLKLKAPNPALLPILSSSSLGRVDSKLVSQKGGDASPEAEGQGQGRAVPHRAVGRHRRLRHGALRPGPGGRAGQEPEPLAGRGRSSTGS